MAKAFANCSSPDAPIDGAVSAIAFSSASRACFSKFSESATLTPLRHDTLPQQTSTLTARPRQHARNQHTGRRVQLGMRDLAAIDAELRLIAAVRAACRTAGGTPPDTAMIDQLLDERNRRLTQQRSARRG